MRNDSLVKRVFPFPRWSSEGHNTQEEFFNIFFIYFLLQIVLLANGFNLYIWNVFLFYFPLN